MGYINGMTREEFEAAIERARDYYNEIIKPQLTFADKGRVIAIDGNTLEWEIGDSHRVEEKLRVRVPDAAVYLTRYITPGVFRFGGAPKKHLKGFPRSR